MKEGRKDWKREGGLKENLIDRQAAAAAHSSFHSSRNHSPFSENSGGKDPKSPRADSALCAYVYCFLVLDKIPKKKKKLAKVMTWTLSSSLLRSRSWKSTRTEYQRP